MRFAPRQVTALSLALALIATGATCATSAMLTSCGRKQTRTAEEHLALAGYLDALINPKEKQGAEGGKAAEQETSKGSGQGNGQVNGSRLFVSPEFLPFIPKKDAALTPTKEESLAAVLDSASFYRLQREKHYSAVLLSPYPSSVKLADSLLSSPLWTLSDASPTGYLFRPIGSAPWQLPKLDSLTQLHPDPTARASWLISTAANLILIGKRDDAEQLLVMAATTKKHPSLLLSTRASLAASRGHWNEAMILARESLAKDSNNSAAQTTQVRALIECGQSDEAFKQARNLVKDSPNQDSLFLLARAANASGDKEEEITALKRLVELGGKENQPLGASLTYLGQAYAKNGERGEAIRTFQKAIASPELNKEQRKMIKELMDHIAVARER